ncbi:hypothetical protein EVG20_g8304 [Dentipellis fragilis]|uniref:Protein kinase domain-containing protein n=1 Tax=Dentipellis fragilis TaxID=205917 RepID=A0A4Y9Y6R8_9AGAM|nr:hypothetical protein EVG20_g8304 [Dentipellis fragilis]
MKEYATAPSDVWALGIILINMITNRNPWRYAVTQDPCFSAFLEDVLYLREMLPISKEANKLFRRVFTLTPHCRITLSQLRVAVQEMDTFFMTDRELQRASDVVLDNAILYAEQGMGQDILFASEASSEKSDPNSPCSTCSSCSSSLGSDEILAFVYSDFRGPAIRPPRDTPAQRAPLLKSSDGSSSADSAGPITPETHPIHPAAEVPPLSDDEGLCEAVLLPVGSPLLADLVPKAGHLDMGSPEKVEV